MDLMGLPTENDFAEMMGFVTDEDREKWSKMEEMKRQRSQAKGNPLSQAASGGVNLMQQSVQSKMTSASINENDNRRESTPRRREWVERTEFEGDVGQGDTGSSGPDGPSL